MSIDAVLEFIRRALIEPLSRLGAGIRAAARAGGTAAHRARGRLALAALLALAAWGLYARPPFTTAQRGEILLRTNVLDSSTSAYTGGLVLVMPGIHQLRRYATRDQVYRPLESASASGAAPFQSVEGLSLGVDLTIRWAIDPARLPGLARDDPDDLTTEVVAPAVRGVVYRLFARYSVRDIFSAKRAEIQQQLAAELRPKLASMGLVLRGVEMGKVDLPADYRRGMEQLLAEELQTEKMRYTLELKTAQVKETQLVAEADKVRRQKAAEAAGEEQVIAARAQEETMKHILPFKQKQIQQRQLEAEADKQARIRTAEGSAEARRIEAGGEADSRQRLADAEAYRLDQIGKSNAGQMEREGTLLARYPLLIQKTLADKLSDKVQVIIAPSPQPGGFIGSNLIGTQAVTSTLGQRTAALAAEAEPPR